MNIYNYALLKFMAIENTGTITATVLGITNPKEKISVRQKHKDHAELEIVAQHTLKQLGT